MCVCVIILLSSVFVASLWAKHLSILCICFFSCSLHCIASSFPLLEILFFCHITFSVLLFCFFFSFVFLFNSSVFEFLSVLCLSLCLCFHQMLQQYAFCASLHCLMLWGAWESEPRCECLCVLYWCYMGSVMYYFLHFIHI